MQCTAKCKRTGERCRAQAVSGYPVCSKHGAGYPSLGRAGGRPIKHGRYSKRLPKGLLAAYRCALRDAELVELRDEIALVDARIWELLGQLSTGESLRQADNATWREVFELVEQRRKLADSERRRMVDLQQMVSVERVLLLIDAIADIIIRHVPDERMRGAIVYEIGNILGAKGLSSTESEASSAPESQGDSQGS